MKAELSYMKDKLNDISKKNRSIRLLKLHNKWNFDLTELNEYMAPNTAEQIIKSIVLDQKAVIPLLHAKLDNEASLKLSKKLTDLYRNIKGIEEETGLYDFYLGYPFLSGTMLDNTFFQAPLFLYPIRFERDPSNQMKWILRSVSEEPQINRTLFLAMKKINGLEFSEDWFESMAEIASRPNLEECIQKLQGIDARLELSEKALQPISEYKQNEIPDQKNFKLLYHAVIGNFPQGSSSIVKDYEQLIKINKPNQLGLAGLLVNGDDEKEWMEEDWNEQEKELSRQDIKEQDQLYLLQTDGSQESILKDARFQKGMVIHGPPGTGKSQVIVNLITDALAQKKKILVVCQKRAALDVIYQRMDSIDLGTYTALIHNEKSDRKRLYNQIGSLLSISTTQHSQAGQDLIELSSKIDFHQDQLNKVASVLYTHQPFGYRLYDLYGMIKPEQETSAYLDIKDILPELNKNVLMDILTAAYTYAEWYSKYGREDYLLKKRPSYAAMDFQKKLEGIDIINKLIQLCAEANSYFEQLNSQYFKPSYAWSAEAQIVKVRNMLEDDSTSFLEKFKRWSWMNFAGKSIVRDLQQQNNKHMKTAEWSAIRQDLIVLLRMAEITREMKKNADQLKLYFNGKQIEKIQQQIADGEMPISFLNSLRDCFQRDFDELNQMDNFYRNVPTLSQKIIDRLCQKGMNVSKNNKRLAETWKDLVKNSACMYWINQVEQNNPEVRKVSSQEFTRLRENFTWLVDEKRQVGRKYLVHKLENNILGLQQKHARTIKELEHQVNKKSRIWPLRKLIDTYASTGLLDVMPVWLASPETVSSIFPLEANLFDMVIFDEASQCTVEIAIPAAYRGAQIIVAGDEKQLAPYNGFKAILQSDEEEEVEYDIEESISVLNLAKRRFKVTMLQWHYRSKSEELINFSNHAFYDGLIQIAPSVEPLQNPPALMWEKVNGRWINTCNEVEALKAVDTLKQLLIRDINKSIGIITFNAAQQTKILDMIDLRIQEDADFNVLYQSVMGRELDERIFVKNIENVQGDERDIIIFSIGFAKNEEGRIYNRFGSLNVQHGENRLNVAVTRAKEKIIVISSIEPEELNVANVAHMGPRLLKSYLKYVKAVASMDQDQIANVIKEVGEGRSMNVKTNSLHFDSPFEEQVYNKLVARGYTVNTQIGMSGYRIDLAIIHPKDHQRYILGIECDGAMYHSSASAKERDIYRQRFLESRGWNIERIWSRNWWKNAEIEVERIQTKIDQLVKAEEIRERVEQI